MPHFEQITGNLRSRSSPENHPATRTNGGQFQVNSAKSSDCLRGAKLSSVHHRRHESELTPKENLVTSGEQKLAETDHEFVLRIS